MGEAENVIHEEEHVLVLFVAEILGHREGREGHAHTGTRGFVHLAVNEGDLRLGEVVLLDDAGFGHFVVKVITFAGALTDAGEHGVTTVGLGDVVDEFHDHDGLAHAGATEGADLAALGEGGDQVDDLDAGLEDVGLGVLVGERGGRTMDRVTFGEVDRAFAVHGVAGDVEDAAKDAFADGHRDRGAGVNDGHAADEALGGGHGDRAGDALAEMLLDLESQLFLATGDGEVHGEGLVDRGNRVFRELDVNDGADDLDDFAGVAHERRVLIKLY